MKRHRLEGRKRCILLFILGMMVFLYPAFSNLYYNYITMEGQRRNLPPPLTAPPASTGEGSVVTDKEFEKIGSDPAMEPLLNKQIEYLREYNKRLLDASEYTGDPFGEGDGVFPELEVSEDGDGASIFAYIKIERINQTLPIYLGATDEHLKKGVAVIRGTSIPVGGEGTNSVIAGHTGLVKRFFTDLPELRPGDEIEITNRWETLRYRVTGNKLIWPSQEEYLAVAPGKDRITLLTCYHGTPGNDRLLVFAERYYPEEKVEEPGSEKPMEAEYSYLAEVELKVKPWYGKAETYAIGSAVLLLGIFIYNLFKKRSV